MKFIDIAKIFIKSGDGGPGHISFRREKSVPKGGPDGGNGGKGGDIIFLADPHLNTLLDFKYKKEFIAKDGNPGQKARKTGKSSPELIIKVPVGTIIKNDDDGEILADLTEKYQKVVIARGGDGGRGNSEFSTPTNQTPRYAEPGWPGKEFNVILEMKLIADVGIVGLPNVGKSTLISVISAAKPKIADYPFTTLIPNLGIVRIADNKSYTVADIPGLIEGASEGKGLGIQFLRHIERTRVLLFLIDCLSATPLEDFKILVNELKKYNPELLKKERIICLSRIDCIDLDTRKQLEKLNFKDKKSKKFAISSVSGDNIEQLKLELWNKLEPIDFNS